MSHALSQPISLYAAVFGGGGSQSRSESWDPAASERQHDAERALVDRVRSGDELAFRELMDTYFNRVARFTYGIVKSREVAQDIAQDVLANVWHARKDWSPRYSIKSYLFGAARNRALNELKHLSVKEVHEGEIELEITTNATGTDIHDRLTLERAVRALRIAVSHLPERRQTALRLRYEEGMTYPAIAATLGISVKSAEQLVALTVKALRKELKDFT